MSTKWRNTKDYRTWVSNAIKKQKCCYICGSTTDLEVHHIKNGAHNPKYRFDPNNAVVLCDKHHTLFHCKYKKSFRYKTTEDDWNDFIAIVDDIKNLNKES